MQKLSPFFKLASCLSFIVFGIVPSLMILSQREKISEIGIIISLLIFFVTVQGYWELRKTQKTEKKGFEMYKLRGLGLYIEGFILLVLSGTTIKAHYYHGYLMLIVAILIAYEGKRAWNGWKLFIPHRK